MEHLVSMGKVKTPADLYRLDVKALSEVDRISEHVAGKLLTLLNEKRELPLETFWVSLFIPICSSSSICLIMDAGYDTWEKIQACSSAQLEAVSGIGPGKASALLGWINTIGKTLVPDLFASGVKVKVIKTGALTGLSFCFTGKSTMKRDDLEALVVNNGGVVKTSVGRGFSYLVMADPNSGSAKAKAAEKNGTKCINEKTLLSMIA